MLGFGLLVVSVGATALALGLCVAALVRRDAARARRWALVAVVVPAAYVGALAAVSLTNRPHDRAPGDWQCFDDWCVTVTRVDRVDDTRRLVHLEVRSEARRVAQRPDHPRASVHSSAGVVAVAVPGLDQRLGPGQQRALEVTVEVTGADPRLVIEEGSIPLIIGDEGSWWHARSGWPL